MRGAATDPAAAAGDDVRLACEQVRDGRSSRMACALIAPAAPAARNDDRARLDSRRAAVIGRCSCARPGACGLVLCWPHRPCPAARPCPDEPGLDALACRVQPSARAGDAAPRLAAAPTACAAGHTGGRGPRAAWHGPAARGRRRRRRDADGRPSACHDRSPPPASVPRAGRGVEPAAARVRRGRRPVRPAAARRRCRPGDPRRAARRRAARRVPAGRRLRHPGLAPAPV